MVFLNHKIVMLKNANYCNITSIIDKILVSQVDARVLDFNQLQQIIKANPVTSIIRNFTRKGLLVLMSAKLTERLKFNELDHRAIDISDSIFLIFSPQKWYCQPFKS